LLLRVCAESGRVPGAASLLTLATGFFFRLYAPSNPSIPLAALGFFAMRSLHAVSGR
jgi:hypothetical protein